MPDLRQISLPYEVREVVEKMVETFNFTENLDAVKFCVAYAIKNFPEEIKSVQVEEGQARGFDYSVSSFYDNEILDVINAIFQDEEPFRFIKSAAILGARKINEKMQDKIMDDITELM